MKLPGVISFRNDLPTCAIPNGGLRRASWATFLKLMKIPWRRLGTEVRGRALVLQRPDVRLEHEVELARFREVAVGRFAGVLARLATAAGELKLVGTKAELAGAAVDERVGETGYVAGRLPDARVEDDRGVERDDVVALLHHRPEPVGANVVFRQDAVVAVVVRRAEAAVDLGGGEDEAAAAAQGDDGVHRQRLCRLGHGRRLPGRFGGIAASRHGVAALTRALRA